MQTNGRLYFSLFIRMLLQTACSPAILLSLSLTHTHTHTRTHTHTLFHSLLSTLTHSLLVEYHGPLYSPVKHQFLVLRSNRGKRTKHIFLLLNDSKTIVLSAYLKSEFGLKTQVTFVLAFRVFIFLYYIYYILCKRFLCNE